MARFIEKTMPCRLLLVEGNPDDVFLFRRTVDRLKLNIDLVVDSTADAALARLKTISIERTPQWPDLILTNIDLPGSTGVELLRVIKGDEETKRIPCIVVTSSKAQEDIVAAYDAHANGYVTKGTSIELYEAALEGLMLYWFRTMHTPSWEAPSLPRIRSTEAGVSN
jgi:CheY-like chemotaxis protein